MTRRLTAERLREIQRDAGMELRAAKYRHDLIDLLDHIDAQQAEIDRLRKQLGG